MEIIKTKSDLKDIRRRLGLSATYARHALGKLSKDSNPLYRLKFERLGCDPLDVSNKQNLIEQTNQQATYEVAIDALEYLFKKYPGRSWKFSPGATGRGHDIYEADGEIAAEVFAATSPSSNDKLNKDKKKMAKFAGKYRYIFYRSPKNPWSEKVDEGIHVISLGSRE